MCFKCFECRNKALLLLLLYQLLFGRGARVPPPKFFSGEGPRGEGRPDTRERRKTSLDNASLEHFNFIRSPLHWGQNVGHQKFAFLEHIVDCLMNFLTRSIVQESVVDCLRFSMLNTQNNNSAKFSWSKRKLSINYPISSWNLLRFILVCLSMQSPFSQYLSKFLLADRDFWSRHNLQSMTSDLCVFCWQSRVIPRIKDKKTR